MKIAATRVDVIRREAPYTKLQPELGGFGGEIDQGLLRVLTDDGIEGNCGVGQREPPRPGSRGGSARRT